VFQAEGPELFRGDLSANELSRALLEYANFIFDRVRGMALVDFLLQHGWLQKTNRPTAVWRVGR
jgi:hypothetical protein